MKTRNKFEETKIRMVMKLRGLTRAAAIKALKLDNSQAEAVSVDAKHTTVRVDRRMTAKEFFGGVGDEDELITAKEFFGEE